MDQINNSNLETNNKSNITNNNTSNVNNLNNSLRCQTFIIDSKPKNGNIKYSYNKNQTFKVSSYLFDQKHFIKKKPKKKVKFVDEAYNKSLIEEIYIKSFKGYNMRNNYTSSYKMAYCKPCKKSVCCLII